MIIKPEGGLANRLRVILSRLEPGLKVVWDWRDPIIAGARFTDVFEPLPEVEFVDDGPFDLETCDAVDQFQDWWLYRYDLLKPKEHIQSLVDALCDLMNKWQRGFGLDGFNAMHIRRTDIPRPGSRHTWCTQFTEDAHFLMWGNNVKGIIYLATDNQHTQREMQEAFGDRVVWAKSITDTRDKWSQDRTRATSLEDAVIDAWVAARSSAFVGTYGTSFSYLIEVLRHRHALKRAAERASP